MSYSFQQLFASVQLTNAVATYYTAASVVQVQKATLVNPSGAACWAKLWIVPTGDTAGDENLILPQYSVPDGESFDIWPLIGQALASGDRIQAQAQSNAALTLFASGMVIS